MRNTKSLLIVFFVCLILFIIPNISNAAVEYTRTITGNDGSIIINLTGLTLDENKSYSYALVTKGGLSSNTTWHTLTTFDTTTAKITLSSLTSDIVAVLKSTDTGYLYIKDNSATDNTYVLNAKEINLKLPYLQAINYSKSSDGWYSIGELYNSLGGKLTGNTYMQFKKVTDKTFIEKYLNLKNKNSAVTELESYLPTVPTTGYAQSGYFSSENYSDGLYLLWIKIVGTDCKDIYGCIIHDGLPKAKTVSDYINVEGPKVTRIEVNSPASGTYKKGQTVKIRVYFDGEITGITMPTLKIKFGTGTERSVTNGTIYNDKILNVHYIEYSYNIQSGDNGQLVTVSLTGGTIKDTDGNNAILSCPVLTGNITIKADTEEKVTNNTESNNTSSDNKTSTSTKKDKTSTSLASSKSNKKDTTTATGKIPYTGASYVIIFMIVIILIGGIIAKVKCNDLKGIK